MVDYRNDHLGEPLEEAVMEQFAASFRGELVRPEDDGYDEARKVYNGMIDKRPALIVRPTGAADVIDAVNLARENNKGVTRIPFAIGPGQSEGPEPRMTVLATFSLPRKLVHCARPRGTGLPGSAPRVPSRSAPIRLTTRCS